MQKIIVTIDEDHVITGCCRKAMIARRRDALVLVQMDHAHRIMILRVMIADRPASVGGLIVDQDDFDAGHALRDDALDARGNVLCHVMNGHNDTKNGLHTAFDR